MRAVRLYIPESWDAMSERQLEKIAFLFYGRQTDVCFYIKLFFLLNGARWWQFSKKARLRIVLGQCPLSDLHKSYEYVFSQNNRTVFPEMLRVSKSKKGIRFAPQARIANLTADEFAVADDLHIKWRETNNIEYLQYLAAVLYTPLKTRPLFDKNDLHQKAAQFANVPLKKLLAMEMAYFGCKNNLVKRFPKVFPKPKPGAAKPKKKYGFSKVILSMARGDLSKLEAIRKVNIYTFLEQFQEDLTPKKS